MMPQLATDTADVVIITALTEERDAVLAALGQAVQLPPHTSDPNVYHRAVLSAGSGQFDVVLTSLIGMGRVQAALATNDAIRHWQPDYVMLVGIAGGFRGVVPELQLGDVLVANEIIDYELQKIRPEGPEIRDTRPPVSVRLVIAAQNFSGDWYSTISEPRPAPGRPTLHFGPVATGDKVLNNPTMISALVSRFPRLVGVEMEAGGAASAALRGETNFFMVRAVSDFADGTKDSVDVGKWRAYACSTAATYAVSLLRSGLVPAPTGAARVSSNSRLAGLVKSTVGAVSVLDKVSDDVTSLLTGTPMSETPQSHGFSIDANGLEVRVRDHGQVIQTITGRDLERLPPSELQHVLVLEQSLKNHYAVWEEVRPQLAMMVDPVMKARVKQQLKQIAEEMKSALRQLLEFLVSAGFYLDDHYLEFRDVIAHPY